MVITLNRRGGAGGSGGNGKFIIGFFADVTMPAGTTRTSFLLGGIGTGSLAIRQTPMLQACEFTTIGVRLISNTVLATSTVTLEGATVSTLALSIGAGISGFISNSGFSHIAEASNFFGCAMEVIVGAGGTSIRCQLWTYGGDWL